MNHQHTEKEHAALTPDSNGKNRFLKGMYIAYYVHMTLLSVIAYTPSWQQALADSILLQSTLMTVNLVILLFCVYALIRNKQLADWFMERMPEWMWDAMDRMPAWTNRWMTHKSMRIMMVLMDIMLAWMCVEFAVAMLK